MGHFTSLSQCHPRANTHFLAYRSLQTVGSLLLTNSDFRLFLSDLNVVGREVFKDAAFKLSGVAEEAGKQLEPSDAEQQKLKQPGADDGPRPSGDDLGRESTEVAEVVVNGAILRAMGELCRNCSGLKSSRPVGCRS